MRLIRSIPALPVRNVRQATEFYRDRLGFDVGHQDDTFAIVTRDGVELHLWAAHDESWQDRSREGWSHPVVSGAESFIAGTSSCRIEVEGIDALYDEFRASAVLYDSSTRIEHQPWGTREFPVLDLERNLLTFYERVERARRL